jgi:anti-sigma factor RsiW
VSQAASAHPAAETLEHFMRGELPQEEALAVVRHLLTGCPRCIAVTRRHWTRGDQPLALRILLEEGLASQAEASRTAPFRLPWGRGKEP